LTHEGLAIAEAMFAAGNYEGAKQAYRGLSLDPTLTDEERALVEKRLRALTPDRLAIAFGTITAAIVILVYILSRLGHA
jgi:hypothetical protein